MKKKISLVLSMILLMCVLGACGTNSENQDYNGRSVSELSTEAVTDAYYISYLAANLGGQTLSEDEKAGLTQYGFTAEQIDASVTWAEVEKEFGSCPEFASEDFDPTQIDTSSFKVTKSGETLTTDLTLKFGEKEVIFQVVYDYYSMKSTGYTIEPVYSLSEKMSKAGMNTLISISIVFCVLILISLVIYAFNIFPYMEKKKKEKALQNQPVVEAASVKSEAVEQPVADTNTVDDAELIAVIAAAIAASEGTSTSGFVVRSINRR